jgi:GNAT superfamily N-acetyltransferase
LGVQVINLLPIEFSEDSLAAYAALFSVCFPRSHKYSVEYLRWLYCENPAGLAIGFDAWDDGKLAAHYVCVPADASVGGRNVKVLLSLNTATHPSYQGKGLFTKLAEMTYNSGSEKGFDCVYGVANANSTPGFVRKLGFQLVEPLEARVGIGGLHIDYELSRRCTQFERIWSQSGLDWRCSNPGNAIYWRKCAGMVQYHARVLRPVVSVYAEFSPRQVEMAGGIMSNHVATVRLFLGLVPGAACKFRQYFHIPHRLRPSPLNFIYRSLSAKVATIEKGQVSLSFLDFDAY